MTDTERIDRLEVKMAKVECLLASVNCLTTLALFNHAISRTTAEKFRKAATMALDGEEGSAALFNEAVEEATAESQLVAKAQARMQQEMLTMSPAERESFTSKLTPVMKDEFKRFMASAPVASDKPEE